MCEAVPFFFDDQKKRAYIQVGGVSFLPFLLFFFFLSRASARGRAVWELPSRGLARLALRRANGAREIADRKSQKRKNRKNIIVKKKEQSEEREEREYG